MNIFSPTISAPVPVSHETVTYELRRVPNREAWPGESRYMYELLLNNHVYVRMCSREQIEQVLTQIVGADIEERT